MTSNIDKKYLSEYVSRNINYMIHARHVRSIINILFEEMQKDLISGKKIRIFNFGTLILKEMRPRYHHNLKLKKFVWSSGLKNLKMYVSKQIRKKLCECLEIDTKIKKT